MDVVNSLQNLTLHTSHISIDNNYRFSFVSNKAIFKRLLNYEVKLPQNLLKNVVQDSYRLKHNKNALITFHDNNYDVILFFLLEYKSNCTTLLK